MTLPPEPVDPAGTPAGGSADASDHALPGPVARIVQLVFPNQANHYGTLFGGDALRMMDEAGFIAASRWARQTMVTVSSERVDFQAPIRAGELVETAARVVAVGRTSVTVEIELHGENVLTGERRLATRGRFVFVAVDDEGRPTPVRR